MDGSVEPECPSECLTIAIIFIIDDADSEGVAPRKLNAS